MKIFEKSPQYPIFYFRQNLPNNKINNYRDDWAAQPIFNHNIWCNMTKTKQIKQKNIRQDTKKYKQIYTTAPNISLKESIRPNYIFDASSLLQVYFPSHREREANSNEWYDNYRNKHCSDRNSNIQSNFTPE